MNVGIGTEAAQFLFWEYILWIFGAVRELFRAAALPVTFRCMENNGVDPRYTLKNNIRKMCTVKNSVVDPDPDLDLHRRAWILVGWIQVDKNDPKKVKDPALELDPGPH
jgi:hypothetical protein